MDFSVKFQRLQDECGYYELWWYYESNVECELARFH